MPYCTHVVVFFSWGWGGGCEKRGTMLVWVGYTIYEVPWNSSNALKIQSYQAVYLSRNTGISYLNFNSFLSFFVSEWFSSFLSQGFNVSSDDLNDFFGGPAFLAWARMGNLHGYVMCKLILQEIWILFRHLYLVYSWTWKHMQAEKCWPNKSIYCMI